MVPLFGRLDLSLFSEPHVFVAEILPFLHAFHNPYSCVFCFLLPWIVCHLAVLVVSRREVVKVVVFLHLLNNMVVCMIHVKRSEQKLGVKKWCLVALLPGKSTELEILFWADQLHSYTSQLVNTMCSQKFLEVNVRLRHSVPIGLYFNCFDTPLPLRRSVNEASLSILLNPLLVNIDAKKGTQISSGLVYCTPSWIIWMQTVQQKQLWYNERHTGT